MKTQSEGTTSAQRILRVAVPTKTLLQGKRYTDSNHTDVARALAPMAPPQSVVHQIIQEDDLLAADRARNTNKAERATQANADRALDLQIKFQNLPGAWV
jgi:hypothetical protein